MNAVAPKPLTSILPPFWFLLAVAEQWFFDHFLPIAHIIPEHLRMYALFFAGLAFLMMLPAVLQFFSHRTTVKPTKASSKLVTGGVYRISRNPMYLSMVFCLIAVAIAIGSITPWLTVPAFMWLIWWMFIRAEEEALTETFGDEYTAYCSRVRRWL